MDKPAPDSSLLKQMVREGNYASLDLFEDKDQWARLSDEERELLGQLFVWRGRDQLGRGEETASESFRLAETVAPSSANVFYWQGLAWIKSAQRGGPERYFSYACDKLKEAVQLAPQMYRARHCLGVALTHLGHAYSEMDPLTEADQCFSKAAEDWPAEDGGALRLHWDWGVSLGLAGHLSGEAVDFRRALDAFRMAARYRPKECAFWLQYGDTVTSLARLVNQYEMLEQTVECYNRAVRLGEERSEAWHALAVTHKQLYELKGEEEHLTQSQHCFAKASSLAPERCEVWTAWAGLLLEAGRRLEEHSFVEQALQKMQRAEEWASLDADGMALRTQLYLALGALGDDLDSLSEAERLAREALSEFPESAELWCCLGDCHVALAGYFAAPERYQVGIEKYVYALSLDSECFPAFVGLAEAYFAHGMVEQSRESFESCCKWSEDAINRDRGAAHLWGMWGMALLRIGEIADRKSAVEEAVQKLCHAVSLRGGIEGSPELDWLFHLGTGLDFLGTFGDEPEFHQQAVDILLRVLEAQPDDPLVRFQLGLAWLHLGEVLADGEYYERAEEQFRLIVEQDPDEDIAWDEWGCVLLGHAELLDDLPTASECEALRREAEEKFTRAIALGNAESYYHLAWLHCQRGEYGMASHCLRQAQERGALPSPEELFHDDRLSGLKDSDFFGDFLKGDSDPF